MPRYIRSDGKNYTFNPGKNGSLTAVQKPASSGFQIPTQSVAKTIGPRKKVNMELRRKRQMIAPALVGSQRG